jgi:sec-independent protein translocase protein TatA
MQKSPDGLETRPSGVLMATLLIQPGDREISDGGLEMLEGLFQPTHLIVILAIALLLFGPKKLPELGQGLGKGIRGFKDALKGIAADSESPQPDETSKITK